MAADIYTAPPNEGHAGWTWYTGAAGWMYQAGLEWILGLRRKGNLLFINPCIPTDWPGFSVTYRYGHSRYYITVISDHSDEKPYLKKDGKVTELFPEEVSGEGASVELQDDGQEHHVELKLNK
jgi:cellobiose phosphorylase